MSRIRVNLDVDGVMADFDGHCETLFGAAPRSLTHTCPTSGETTNGDPALWAHVESCPEFWLDMPIKYAAHELVDIARPYGVRFLTGCPATGYERADKEKRIKLEKEFPGIPVITCRSKHKSNFMEQPGDILVDDFIANIRRWQKAGGYGVYYKTHKQAVEDLKDGLARQFPEIKP